MHQYCEISLMYFEPESIRVKNVSKDALKDEKHKIFKISYKSSCNLIMVAKVKFEKKF